MTGEAERREEPPPTAAERLSDELRLNRLLMALLRGTTGVGKDYFASLACSLTEALKVRYAFISVRVGDWSRDPPMLRLVAFCEGKVLLPPFEYDTRGTPCAAVIDGCPTRIDDGAAEAFPQDDWFVEAGIRGYHGVPIVSEGRVLGHLGIADDHPLPADDGLEAILESCADRCASELERERLVREAAWLAEQYRHAQKMEAVGRLAGGVAHDFNNMLTVIFNSAQFLRDDLPEGTEERQTLEEIIAASKRSAELTRQLLALSRKQVSRPETFSLRELLLRMRAILRSMLDDNIEFEFHLCDEAAKVHLDSAQMEQTIINLVVNARDAMPEGGTLSLRLETLPEGELRLRVRDTGEGMPDSVRERIFEPFFTTKPAGKGTGLGLSMIFAFADKCGGRIEVNSSPGRGSIFDLYLPACAEEARRAESGRRRAGTEEGAETILVVEDQDIVRNVVVRLLGVLGYDVLSAASPSEAMSLAARHAGGIDLLLTDVIMPEMNGKELAAAMEKQRPGLKVLYTSGYSPAIISARGALDEDMPLLPKPYSSEVLSRSVRAALGQAPAR